MPVIRPEIIRRPLLGALLLGCLLTVAYPVRAQERELESLDDFLNYAQEHSPTLQQKFENWMAAASAVAVARGWPDPVLSYTNYLASVETALGPQRHAIAISQLIPWFGKLSMKGDAQEKAALAAERRFEQAKLDVAAKTAKAYYDYAYLARAEAITRENLQWMQFQEGVARARYRADSARYTDLIKAQVELGVLEDRLTTLVDQRSAAAAKLNAAIGRAPEASLPWPVPLSDPPDVDRDADRLWEIVARENPELNSADLEIEKFGKLEDFAHRNRYPDFMLGLKTILTDPSELTMFDDRGRDAWMGTISLRLPLGQAKYSGAIDAAKAKKRAAEHAASGLRLTIRSDLERVLFALEDAARKIELYGENLVPKAEQNLRAAGTAYRAGDASFLDFVDAERTLLRFQLELARSRADLGQHTYELLSLTGPAVLRSDSTPRSEAADEADSTEGDPR